MKKIKVNISQHHLTSKCESLIMIHFEIVIIGILIWIYWFEWFGICVDRLVFLSEHPVLF